jgi:hypothetical protein
VRNVERGHAVVEADLFHDSAVDNLQHRGAGEVHLTAGCSRETADQKVVERGTRMGASTFPLTDDVVALGDQIRRAPEIEIGECYAEIGHERLDVVPAAAGFLQRLLEQHVRRGDLVDDRKIDILAPELGKPAGDDRLVIFFLAHWNPPLDVSHETSRGLDDRSEGLRLRRPCRTPVLALELKH